MLSGVLGAAAGGWAPVWGAAVHGQAGRRAALAARWVVDRRAAKGHRGWGRWVGWDKTVLVARWEFWGGGRGEGWGGLGWTDRPCTRQPHSGAMLPTTPPTTTAALAHRPPLLHTGLCKCAMESCYYNTLRT